MRAIAAAALTTTVLAVAGAAQGRPANTAPGAGSIIFHDGPRGGIYAVAAAGGPLKQLVRGRVDEAHWSPDGRKLAFVLRVPPPADWGTSFTGELDVVGIEGGAPRRLLPLGVGSVAWSPDSRRLAYTSQDGRGVTGLHVFDADGSHDRLLVPGEMWNPVWSPDGKKIAFRSEKDLDVIDVASGRVRQLTRGLSVFSPPSWSPDSTRIAFYPCCLKGFAIVDVKSRRIRTLGTGVLIPSWSPNGKWIALGAAGGAVGVALIRTDGRGFHRLGAVGTLTVDPPAWSPDSRAVAVESYASPTGPFDIWVVPADGARPRRLTQGWRYGYESLDPEWQPRSLTTGELPGTTVGPENPTSSIVAGDVLRTTHVVDRLAADDGRVAIDSVDGHTELWEPSSQKVVALLWGCYSPLSKVCLGFALGGERVAWATTETRSAAVLTATASFPRVVNAQFCDEHGCGPNTYEPVDDVQADGSLIAFDSWASQCRLSSYDPPCKPKRDGDLWRLDGARATRIAQSAGPLTVLSVNAGRILVDHEDGTLELFRGDGASLRTFRYEPANFLGAKLQGRDLVVLTEAVVADYDAETGALLHEWPLVAASPRLEDVQGGVAVYVSGAYVYVVRLSDGRTVALPTLGRDPHAQLEAPGLYYSYTVDDATYPGRVRFIPFGELPFD